MSKEMREFEEYLESGRDYDIAMAAGLGDGVKQNLPLAKTLLLEGWTRCRGEEARLLFVHGLLTIDFTAADAQREGLNERLVNDLADEEDIWIEDDGYPGEDSRVPDNVIWSEMPTVSVAEAEEYLKQERVRWSRKVR